MDSLEGKVSVITGAASGIGLALAERSAREGMKVVLADVEPDALEQAVASIGALGAEALGVVTDVSDERSVETLADRSFDAFGAVHLLCNNAGVATGGVSWEAPRSDWEWVFGVNVHGVLNGIRAFVPRMLAQREGHIVNTASMAGLTSMPLSSVYCTSKHAVVAISECLFHELATVGGGVVGCTVLCPEGVNTAINRSARNRPDSLARGPGKPMGEDAVVAGLDKTVEDGVPPSAMADRVFEAVAEGRFYALPPEGNPWRDACHSRLDQIRTQSNPRLVITEA